ncbi:hypothetical protein pdam_00014521 [Pocillopora damicornis]|uniref:Uncharacterized protein n=1 Tax=Pocillopora damicornis TaxID=46731 RepID=A0A3M6V551_POCDA|nr:hypothetical protein pdam_00014521 [Pocillopora damicornis]
MNYVIAEFSFNAVVGFAAIFCEDNIYSFILFRINEAKSEPRNQCFGFKIVSFTFLILGSGACLLSVIFYCITCGILKKFLQKSLNKS